MAKVKTDARNGRRLALAALFVVAGSTALRAQCNDEDIVCVSSGDSFSRVDSNDVGGELNDQIVGPGADNYQMCVSATLTLNGTLLASPSPPCADYGESLYDPLGTYTLPALPDAGPFNYLLDVSYELSCETEECFGEDGPWYDELEYGADVSRPTITGVNAFWYLGGSILSDYGYYAQATWEANPNDATGTPTWTWSSLGAGTGAISLSCDSCTSTTATSESYSSGCYDDISVSLNYGGFTSMPFTVTIVEPYQMSYLGYMDAYYYTDTMQGYIDSSAWILSDSCGYADNGLGISEQFGTFSNDYLTGNNWDPPVAAPPTTMPSYYIGDMVGARPADGKDPQVQPDFSLPAAVAVMHDYFWQVLVGSLTVGAGLPIPNIENDTQQWYLDRGAHISP